MATDKLFGKIYSGIGLDYTLFHGGKNSDPRPKNLGMDVSFKPGLTFEINSSNFIGLAGIYRIYKEDLDLINEYGIGGNTLFKIIGLGQFGTPEVKTSLTYRYFKNEFGLNAQYMKQKIHTLGSMHYLIAQVLPKQLILQIEQCLTKKRRKLFHLQK